MKCKHKAKYFDKIEKIYKCQICKKTFKEVKSISSMGGALKSKAKNKKKEYKIPYQSKKGKEEAYILAQLKKLLMQTDPYCIKCGSSRQLTLAHIIGKKQSRNLKFDIKNVTLLCKIPCHRFFTDNPTDWGIFWKETFPERINYLVEAKRSINIVNLSEIKENTDKFLNSLSKL